MSRSLIYYLLAISFAFSAYYLTQQTQDMSKTRSILSVLYAKEQGEGAGAKVRRSIGTSGMRNFSPFLMLDHFNVAPGAGFPDHPHRGQETITLLKQGCMLHADFTGKQGVLNPGDLQFMTAGRGVVHAEMPYSPEGGNVRGMQLWVDLPKELKGCEPRYRDLRAKEIPVARPNDDVEVSVISGSAYGVESVKDLAYTPVHYYEYTVQPGGEFEQEMPTDFNTFLYLLDGQLVLNETIIPQYSAVFFKRDGNVIKGKVSSKQPEPAHFVLIGGKMLDQPIVQYGPFVETSQKDIYKAFEDYNRGTNGFERAVDWESIIGNGVTPEIYEKVKAQDS